MKILIYGWQGWIGQQFVNCLTKKDEDNSIEIVYGSVRVENKVEVEKEILNINPTHVISFIGRTHGTIDNKEFKTIDYLEQPGKLKENIRDNLYGPFILAQLCKEHHIHYTYMGTGCIFDRDSLKTGTTTTFTESDSPNFFGSSYSIAKGFTDEIMKSFDTSALNLRIRMPISNVQHSRNFITKITNYEKICSIENSMSVLPDLLPHLISLMKERKTGTLNFTNPGTISHNRILDLFKEIVDPLFTYENFTKEEQAKILACDRSNNHLNTAKLEKWCPNVKRIEDAVREALVDYKSTYVPKQPNSKTDYNVFDNIKTLFITGGCGFIGSNFINYFATKYPNIDIINFDALYYCADSNNVCKKVQESKNYNFIHGNLKNYGLLKYIFERNTISHIIHFAAQSHVQTSFSDSLNYTEDNIMGTHNLLEINRLYNPFLKKFIHVSTDEVYGESMFSLDEQHKTEQSILCPTNPYAATKAGAELIAQSYIHSYKMPIVITRGNNVYGPNQYPEKLIPRFINLLKKFKPVTIQGDGSCLRSFLHVNDVCSAFETILEKGTIGEIYNIGCDENMEYSVLEVAYKLIKIIIIGKNNTDLNNTDLNNTDLNKWIKYIDDRPFNDKRYYISNEKLKKLGWSIKIRFDDGLNNLVNSIR